MGDAIESLITAVENLHKLGEAYGDKVGKLMSTISDSVITLAGIWSQCTSRLIAKYRQGKSKDADCISMLFCAFQGSS
jgi:hypothetical protein